MSALNYLTSERDWQIIQKLLLVLEVVGALLVSLQVALDLVEEPLVQIGSFAEFLQNRDLLLIDFVGCIHAVEQVTHVTKQNRIDTNTEKHPQDSEDTLVHCLPVDVAEPNCS